MLSDIAHIPDCLRSGYLVLLCEVVSDLVQTHSSGAGFPNPACQWIQDMQPVAAVSEDDQILIERVGDDLAISVDVLISRCKQSRQNQKSTVAYMHGLLFYV